jgi:hypothetical protein
MRTETLWRLGAGAAVIGGVLRVAAAFIPYTPQSWALEALYAAIDLSLLVGLATLYLREASFLGVAGFTAFGAAFVGLASIVGPDAQTFGVDWYQLGSAVSAVGMAGLGIMLLTGGRMALSALCWILAPIVALTGPGDIAIQAAGVLFGTGFVAAGLSERSSKSA